MKKIFIFLPILVVGIALLVISFRVLSEGLAITLLILSIVMIIAAIVAFSYSKGKQTVLGSILEFLADLFN